MDLDRRHLLALTAATVGAARGRSAGARRRPPRRRSPHSASTPAISACAPAVRTTRAAHCSAPSTRPRARARRSPSRPASIARGNLKLPAGAQLIGARGATRIVLTDGPSLVAAQGADHVTLSGLVLDGGRRALPERRGLLQLESCRSIKIADCEIRGSGRNGIVCIAVDGDVIDTTIADDGGCRHPCARCPRARDRAQSDRRRRQQRHPGLALGRRRRRHHRGRQPHREHRQPLRRLGPIRQCRQRLSRRRT